MNMKLRNRMQNQFKWEEPEDFLAKTGDADSHAYLATRPRCMDPNVDPQNIEEMLRDHIMPQEAKTIDDQVKQWRSFLLTAAEKYPKISRRKKQEECDSECRDQRDEAQ